jgi:peptide chain release factor 2
LLSCNSVWTFIGGIFDFDTKQKRLQQVVHELENPNVWKNPEQAKSLAKERSELEKIIQTVDQLQKPLDDAKELLEIAAAEDDSETVASISSDLTSLEKKIDEIEFQRMFSGPMDINSTYLDVQSGSGGTEAQDWAEMLLRMYLRWGDQHGFKTQLIEVSPGEVAGIKSATVKFDGEYAYGWLRTESGVHRLVRKSPFDAGHRRHTSFASVFVYPEIDDNVQVEINPADLRIDTYRASGAGGQHVQKTDSAVRITHVPTGIIVQCQAERSQHKNRSQAMKQLRAKLYEIELEKKYAERQALEETKTEISWGNQIRSYVLDQSRIKDLRTGIESSNVQAVLDGDLDLFILESLKQNKS